MSAVKVAHPYDPDYAVHPGEVLLEELNERGMLQADLVRLTGYTAKHVNQVVKGKAHVGVAFAVALERVFGVSALFWLRLQVAHDLHVYRAGRDVNEVPHS